METEFEYFAQDDFRVRKPDIKISIQGTPTTGQEFMAVIKLQNPLPMPLKKSLFLLEGCGLEKQLQIKLDEVLNPHFFLVCYYISNLQWRLYRRCLTYYDLKIIVLTKVFAGEQCCINLYFVRQASHIKRAHGSVCGLKSPEDGQHR